MIKIVPYNSYIPITEYAVKSELKASVTGRQTIFIVPESVKASVERRVFDELTSIRGRGADIKISLGDVSAGSLDVDVLSFVRLSHKILSVTGRKAPSDDLLLRNMIYRVLMEAPEDFPEINRLRTHFEYIDMLVDLIGDFRRYGIGVDKIRSLIDEKALTSSKLSELALLMERVEQLGVKYDLPVNETLPDAAFNIVTKAVTDGALRNSRRYRALFSLLGSRFVILGLGSTRNLTPQELRLIKALSDGGAEVSVYALCEGDGTDGSFSEFGRNTIDSLEALWGTVSIDPIVVRPDKVNRLTYIAESYAKGDIYVNCRSIEPDDSVKLCQFAMQDDAVAYIANEINRLVRTEEKYRFSDIRIFCADENYKVRLKSVFKLFGLQMFIDKKTVLLNTPVVRYVLGLLDLSVRNYAVSDVLKLLRTGVLIGARSDLVDIFDNYCLRENIRDGKRLFNENFYRLKYELEEEDGVFELDKEAYTIYDDGKLIKDGPSYLYEHIVRRLLIPLKSVTDSLDKSTTISEKATVLAQHLGGLKFDIEALRDEYLDRGESDTALAIVKGYSEIMTLLASFTGELNNVPISQVQFTSLIRTDMKNKASGSIPLCADSVEISTIESAVYTSCKVLFVIGANADNFPHKPYREGIMTDRDLQTIGLPDKAAMRSKQEFVEAAMLLNAPSDMLYMIASSSEMPSPVLTYFAEALREDEEDISIPVESFTAPVYGDPVKRRHVAEDPDKSYITPAHMKLLLEGRESCSVSSIESYNGCHLKYMLDHALRIRVRADGSKVEANELGILCHSMFEYALRDVKSELSKKTVDDLILEADNQVLGAMADNYFAKAVREEQITNPDKFSPRYAVYPGLKVKRIFMSAYPAFLFYFKESGYSPDDFEVKLQELPNKIEVHTSADGIDFEFKFRGSIDRVDRCGDKVRVVDYKTGYKKIDYKEASEGVQIQLFTYAYGLSLQPGNEVDNVGYVRTYLPTSKSKNNTNEKPFEYLASDRGKYDIKLIMEHAHSTLEKTCASIASGDGAARLTASEFDGACKFCGFKGICGRFPDKTKPDRTYADKLIESWKINEKKGKK